MVLGCSAVCRNNGLTSPYLFIPHLGQELIEAAKLDKLPYSIHGVKVEVQVMDSVQDRREDLARHKQMPQIGAGVLHTHGATAPVIDRSGIFLVFGVFDDDVSIAREQPAVARVSGGPRARAFGEIAAGHGDTMITLYWKPG